MVDRTLTGKAIISAIKASDIEFVVALPDIVTCEKILWPIRQDNELTLVQVCKEDEGVSICGALSYTKKRSILLIQHTGFLDSINAIRAIAVQYQLPVVMFVGLQGMEPDRKPYDSDHYGIRILEPILQGMELDYRILITDEDLDDVSSEVSECYRSSKPMVYLIARNPE